MSEKRVPGWAQLVIAGLGITSWVLFIICMNLNGKLDIKEFLEKETRLLRIEKDVSELKGKI